MVCCRAGASRAPPVSSGKRCASRVRSTAGGSTLTRAAASSNPSGSPSTWRQIVTTALAFSAVSANSGRTSAARATNNRTAGTPASSATGGTAELSSTGTASGATGNSRSPRSRNRVRLVARTDSELAARSSPTSGMAGNRCSQLSRTSSRRHSASTVLSSSGSGRSPRSPTPSPCAIAFGTSTGSRIGARSTQTTPSAKSGTSAVATAMARRVLPTPPGPVRVRSRVPAAPSAGRSNAHASATSSSRPTSGVRGRGSRDEVGRGIGLAAGGSARAGCAALIRLDRDSASSPRASARRRTVSARGARRRPRSRSCTPRALTPARSASASCVSPAVNRC
jgi:hypothetical protein